MPRSSERGHAARGVHAFRGLRSESGSRSRPHDERHLRTSDPTVWRGDRAGGRRLHDAPRRGQACRQPHLRQRGRIPQFRQRQHAKFVRRHLRNLRVHQRRARRAGGMEDPVEREGPGHDHPLRSGVGGRDLGCGQDESAAAQCRQRGAGQVRLHARPVRAHHARGHPLRRQIRGRDVQLSADQSSLRQGMEEREKSGA